MSELLAASPDVEIIVPSPFRLLVDDGFRTVDGCVFFRRFFEYDELGAMHIHRDRTGYEAAVNKIHLEDYREPGMTRDPVFLAHTAARCAQLLADRLHRYATHPFMIIASVDDRYCPFRFYQVREGERWLLGVDAYSEALFVVDI